MCTPDHPLCSSISQTKQMDPFSGPQPGVQNPAPMVGCYTLTLPGSDHTGLSCLSAVPLLVAPNHESLEGDPLTVAASGSFQSASVRGGVIFSSSLSGLLCCKSPSLLEDGFLCCGIPVTSA